MANLLPASTQGSHTEHVSKCKHPNGAMDGVSRKVQKVSTHASGVGVDLAGLDDDNRWCALIALTDVDTTSILPNNEADQ